MHPRAHQRFYFLIITNLSTAYKNGGAARARLTTPPRGWEAGVIEDMAVLARDCNAGHCILVVDCVWHETSHTDL